jgi:hypothetical protein
MLDNTMMIKHTAIKNNFSGKHYSPAGAGEFQVVGLINGLRTTTNQKRFQDLSRIIRLASFSALCF